MMMPTMPKSTCDSLLDDVEHELAALAQWPAARSANSTREEQHLQDLALGERADDGVRNDVEQEFDRALHLRLGA